MGEVPVRSDVLHLQKIINFYQENGMGKEGNCFLKENPFTQQSLTGPSDMKMSGESSTLAVGEEVVMVPSSFDDPVQIEKGEGKVNEDGRLEKSGLASSSPERGINTFKGRNEVRRKHQPKVMVKTDWLSLLVGAKEKKFKLQFVEPKEVNGKIVVNPSVEAVNAGMKKWENAVIGQFMTRKPPFLAMQRVLQGLWGKMGSFQIFSLENGIYMFKFENPGIRKVILDRGSWIIVGLPMVVYEWRPNLQMARLHMKTIPIWIKLYNVPPEYWCEDGISCLASAIGVPLYVDDATERGNLMSFMRICVEISVDSLLPSSFAIQMEEKEIIIAVEYPWMPKKCSICKMFGHNEANCSSKKEEMSILKTTSSHIPVNEVCTMGTNQENVNPNASIEGTGDAKQRKAKGKERVHVDEGNGNVDQLGEVNKKMKDVTEREKDGGKLTPRRTEVVVPVFNSFSTLFDEEEKNNKEEEGCIIVQQNGNIYGDKRGNIELELLGSSPEIDSNRFKGMARLDEVEKKMFAQKKKRKKEKGDKGIFGTNICKDDRSGKKLNTPREGSYTVH